MAKKEILLKIARLKLEFEQRQLERYEVLVRHSALSPESLDQQRLKVNLAQCDVDLAQLDN
jgi:multidrug resistance efflux pump